MAFSIVVLFQFLPRIYWDVTYQASGLFFLLSSPLIPCLNMLTETMSWFKSTQLFRSSINHLCDLRQFSFTNSPLWICVWSNFLSWKEMLGTTTHQIRTFYSRGFGFSFKHKQIFWFGKYGSNLLWGFILELSCVGASGQMHISCKLWGFFLLRMVLTCLSCAASACLPMLKAPVALVCWAAIYPHPSNLVNDFSLTFLLFVIYPR